MNNLRYWIDLVEGKIDLTESKVGRDLQHLEDLVFVDGSAGALEALNILQRFGSDVSDVSIKWDGTPAVIFGRDQSGDFILTDKAGFAAKNYNGKVKSATELENMLLSRGKEVDDARRSYAKSMASVWDDFERAVPTSTRGFFFGDLLYKSRPDINNGYYVFTPNKVTYHVQANSDLGKRIGNSNAGVVVHNFTDLEGNTTPADSSMLSSGSLFVMSPIYVQKTAKVDVSGIEQIRNKVKQHAAAIDNLLAPRPGLSDLKNIIYTYVNQTSKTRQWDKLVHGFEEWLKSSKVSASKQAKILSLPESNVFPIIFQIILDIQKIKNEIIDQLDNSTADVMQSIAGERGGEGYVASKDKVKLVPRHKWVPV